LTRLASILAFFLTLTGLSAQNEDKAIATLLDTGNVGGLSEYFQSQVDMTILGTEAMYSRAQAEMVLARFFKGNLPTGFETKHLGQSKKESSYIIGMLSTAKEVYRLTYLLSEEEGRLRIKQFRLEKAN